MYRTKNTKYAVDPIQRPLQFPEAQGDILILLVFSDQSNIIK